jgi:amidase
MTELWQLGAVEIASAIRKGETSSREVLGSLLGRIEAVNDDLNAVVALIGDEAVAAADAADAAVEAGDELGPLHGVPITVKENIDVAGFATTQGVTAFADLIAPSDAPVVERMRAAGAFPFARTNLPDFGLRVHTDSSLHGLTRNPWNPAVTAGGSSGGEGSALAAGMTPLGLGNDIGGSLRNPAHCNGIASIKPTTGVVPRASALPPEDTQITGQLMLVEGVMARHVADVRAGLLAVAGAHHRDPVSLPARLAEPDPGARLRVAVLTEPPGGRTDPGIAAAIRGAADALADAGHVVADAVPSSYARAHELWQGLLGGDIAVARPLLEPFMGADGMAFLEFTDGVFPPATIESWSFMFAERHGVAREWSAFFQEWDVLLSPTWSLPAFAHGADIASAEGALVALETIRSVTPQNLLGLPAAVVPAGVPSDATDGLPVGAQFTANRFGDLTALAAAQALEDIVGPITPIDPIRS